MQENLQAAKRKKIYKPQLSGSRFKPFAVELEIVVFGEPTQCSLDTRRNRLAGQANSIEWPNTRRDDLKGSADQFGPGTKPFSDIQRIDLFDRLWIVQITKVHQLGQTRQRQVTLTRQLPD